MANAFFTTYANRVDPATVTNLGSDLTDAAYPLGNLFDSRVDQPWKATSGSHQLLIQFAFAAPIAPIIVSLFNHNFTGTDIVLFGNTTPSWGSPPFAATFTLGALDVDLYYPNTFLDLTASAPTYQYWLLASAAANGTVPLVGANGPWALGEITFYNARYVLPSNFGYPWKDEIMRDGIVSQQTRAGVVWSTGSTSRRRKFTGTVDLSDANMAGYVRAWYGYSFFLGAQRPAVFALDGDVPDCRMTYFGQPFKTEGSNVDRNVQQLELIEVSPGRSNNLLGF